MPNSSVAELWPDEPELYDIPTEAAGPSGALPFTDVFLRYRPSGDLFGWTQNAAMGWKPG
jgi:hypothetical protein